MSKIYEINFVTKSTDLKTTSVSQREGFLVEIRTVSRTHFTGFQGYFEVLITIWLFLTKSLGPNRIDCTI